MTPKEVIDKWKREGTNYTDFATDDKRILFSEEDVEKMMNELLASSGNFQKCLADLLLEGSGVCSSIKDTGDFIELSLWPLYATELNSHKFIFSKPINENSFRQVFKTLLKKL